MRMDGRFCWMPGREGVGHRRAPIVTDDGAGAVDAFMVEECGEVVGDRRGAVRIDARGLT